MKITTEDVDKLEEGTKIYFCITSNPKLKG